MQDENITEAKSKVTISAKIHRVAWDRKPSFIPPTIWILLKRFRVPGTYRVEIIENLASSEDGTASAEKQA